jgi:polyisoprenyl-phosphate glycosyltransferase
MMANKPTPSIVIMVAAYNDWESVKSIVPLLDRQLSGRYHGVRVVVIDDGSSEFANANLFSEQSFDAIDEVRVVTLRRNLGNQRAFAVGLGYLASEVEFDFLVLMDSDHEDKPEYVPLLIDRAIREGNKVIFAERTQRSEGRRFQMFYAIYKALYAVLTGAPISYGNFSAIPSILVKRIASISEIWNHFPAGIMKARVPYASIPSERGTRKHGASKMNLVNLAIHGLSGLAVHADVVSVRFTLGLVLFATIAAAGIAAVVLKRFLFDDFVLGWSSQAILALLGIFSQLLIAAALVVFLVLASRNQRNIIPAWDYRKFLLDVRAVYPNVGADEHAPLGNRFP